MAWIAHTHLLVKEHKSVLILSSICKCARVLTRQLRFRQWGGGSACNIELQSGRLKDSAEGARPRNAEQQSLNARRSGYRTPARRRARAFGAQICFAPGNFMLNATSRPSPLSESQTWQSAAHPAVSAKPGTGHGFDEWPFRSWISAKSRDDFQQGCKGCAKSGDRGAISVLLRMLMPKKRILSPGLPSAIINQEGDGNGMRCVADGIKPVVGYRARNPLPAIHHIRHPQAAASRRPFRESSAWHSQRPFRPRAHEIRSVHRLEFLCQQMPMASSSLSGFPTPNSSRAAREGFPAKPKIP